MIVYSSWHRSISSHTRGITGLVLCCIEVGYSLWNVHLSSGEAFLLGFEFLLAQEQAVLARRRPILLLLSLHQLLEKGLLLWRFYLLLWCLSRTRPRVHLVVVFSWSRYRRMDLSIILQVVPSFWRLFLLFTRQFLIFLLQHLMCFLVFLLDLISLNTIATHFVTSAVHLSDSHHL